MNNLREGTLLQGGKYRIVRFIKSGGFGCTYEAEHIALGKRVAIKEFFMNAYCNRDSQTGHVSVGTHSKKEAVDKQRRKFAEEARTLARMHHPGIVNVSDIFEENDTAYYVMDYINGGSLGDLLQREGPLPEQRALGYIRQAAEALSYVHRNNRLHLDLKPGNMMLDDRDKVILIDFGVSKRFDAVIGHTVTPVGMSEGYAPGEQYHNIGSNSFSPATDIYALGATLYKLLTGITPPSAMLRISGEPLDALPASVSAATGKAISQAMLLDKKKRPQSVSEFLAILDAEVTTDDEDTVLDDDEPTVPDIEDPKEQSQLGRWGSYKVKRPGLSGTIEVFVDDPLPMPDAGVLIELEQGNISYSFFLNEGICNTIYAYENGVKVYEEDWIGGIPQDVKDYFIRHGFLSKEHWERETSTLWENGGGDHVKCTFSYANGSEYTRVVEHARYGEYDLLLAAVEELINTTSLKEWKDRAEQVVTRTQRTEKVHMDGVDSVTFLYCEPSFPGWGSFKAEITATSIKVEFAVMGNVVKQHSFPFSKNKFRELKLKLDTLSLHMEDISGSWRYDGCHSIQLTLRGITHTFSAGCLCSGDGEWRSGELQGNIPMLLKVVRQTIPGFDSLWQAAKSAAEPKPTPRPQPSPKPKPQKNETESPEVKNQWWPLLMLLAWGITILLFTWGADGRISLPDWVAVIMFVGNIIGTYLLTIGKKLWGYVALYAPSLLAILWALLSMNANEGRSVVQDDVASVTEYTETIPEFEDSCAVITFVEKESEYPLPVKTVGAGYGVWTGSVKNGIPHGKGEVVFNTEYIFCGVMVSADYKFKGNFENGKPSFGQIYDTNGKIIRTIVP